MAHLEPTVFVVDDDAAVRESLSWLISAVKFPVRAFPSAHEFLEAVPPGQPGCVIIDIRMPGMDGLALQQEVRERHPGLSVIVITGHGSETTAARAMEAGALGYLEKPMDDMALLALVRKGIAKASNGTKG